VGVAPVGARHGEGEVPLPTTTPRARHASHTNLTFIVFSTTARAISRGGLRAGVVGLCSSPVTTTCTRGCCGVPSAGATPRYRVVGREELDLARSWLTTFQASQAFCFWKKKKILHCHATGLTDESKQLSADDHRALHEALEQQRGREASYDMSQLRTRSRGQLHVITNSTVISQLYLATQNKNSLLISASAQLYSPHNSTRHTKQKHSACL
jgi:hypothetical protein